MFFRKVFPPALAALAMVSLLATSSFAAEAPKANGKEQAAATKDAATAEQPKAEAKPPAPTDVMVRVNGKVITRQEVDRAVKVMLAQNQIPATDPEILSQAQAAAVEQLTAAELLYQEASKVEIKDLDKQVADKMAKSKAKFSSDADFEKALKEVDMTLKDITDFTRKDIIISNFVEKRFAAQAKVSDEEIRKFYDQNQEKYFTRPETARASHILVAADEKTSAEDRKKAKEKAEALLKRVKKGEDFAAIAKAESSCPSAAQGGDLGVFARGQMVPAFDKAVFNMKPGEISDIVETQFGYHIIKLTEKQESKTELFEDVKGKIYDFLKKEKVQKDLTEYVDELKRTAKIEKQ